MDKTKLTQISILFEKTLLKRMTIAASTSEPRLDRTEWIRQACREKLERDEQNRAALAAHAQMQEKAK
jgi:hypothetical protein